MERDALRGGDAAFYFKAAPRGGGSASGSGAGAGAAEEALRQGAVWGERLSCCVGRLKVDSCCCCRLPAVLVLPCLQSDYCSSSP